MPEQGHKSSPTRTKSRIKRADNTGSEGCGYSGSARRAKLGFAKQPEGRANSSSVVVEVAVDSKFSRRCCRGVCCSRCCVDGEPSAVAVMNGDAAGDDVPMPRPLGGRISAWKFFL